MAWTPYDNEAILFGSDSGTFTPMWLSLKWWKERTSLRYPIKQSSTQRALDFLMILASDHISGATGLTLTVTIRKPGGSFATPAGVVTEIANGWYEVAANATDTNTLGPLLLHATATGADPCDEIYEIVAYDPHDAVRMGLSALPNAAANAAGGLHTFGTGTGQINPTAGGVDVQTIKTQAVTCAAGVTVEPFVGTVTAALVVDASGRVILQPTQTGVTIPTVTTVTNAVTANTTQLAGQTVTAAAGVTFPASVGTSTLTQAQVTGGAYALNTDGTGNIKVSSGTGANQVSLSSGAVLLQATQTGVTIPTVTTVTNAVTLPANPPSAFLVAASYGTGPAWYTTPPTAAAIATQVWQDLSTGTDFTTTNSIGKLLVSGTPTWYTIPPTAAAITTAVAAGILVTPANLLTTDSSGRVNLNPTQVLSSPRALDAIADGAITITDAFWGAICMAAGKESIVGTSYLIQTPSTGTTIRTFTLNSSVAPTSRV